MNRVHAKLLMIAAAGSLLFSNSILAQDSAYTPKILPPAPRAARVRVVQGPELERADDKSAIITWTSNNPGGTDEHFGDPGLDSLADRTFSRPVFAGKALAHDGYKRRTCRVPFIERAPLKHRDFERAEINFAYSPVSGDDFSLDRSECFAFRVNGREGIGAARRKITRHCC